MLSASHNRAYQDFLALLTDLKKSVDNSAILSSRTLVSSEFPSLQQWFERNIVPLNTKDLEPSIVARWQSIQTEIAREFKLLSTDTSFLASARHNGTQIKRLKSISDRLTKLIGYCQILLDNCEVES